MSNMMRQTMNVFDRACKLKQKLRALKLPDYEKAQSLKDEVSYRLADRVLDIKRNFAKVAYLGADNVFLLNHLPRESIGSMYLCGLSPDLWPKELVADYPVEKKIFDEEDELPFEEKSLDLVLSSLSLHWVNNLPGTFKRVLDCLKPDGCFLGAMFTEETLFELRVSLQLAEQECRGGISPHVSPFATSVDIGNLLHQCGYNLITLDVDEIVINYPGMSELMTDLKCMGESNCAWNRPLTIHRNVLQRAKEIYFERYGKAHPSKDSNWKCIPATYRILYFIAWRPDPSQRKPLPAGSAQFSLKDIDRIEDILKTIK